MEVGCHEKAFCSGLFYSRGFDCCGWGYDGFGQGEIPDRYDRCSKLGQGKGPDWQGKRQSASAASGDKRLSTVSAEQSRKVFFRDGSAPFPEMIFGSPRAAVMRSSRFGGQN